MGHLEKSLSIFRATLGNYNISIGMVLNNIGALYQDQQNTSKALEYFNNALGIYMNCVSENHPDIAMILANIGETHYKLRRYNEALEKLEKTLSITTAAFGADCPQNCINLNAIGKTWHTLKNYNRAHEFYQKALRIADIHCHDRSLKIACYSNLGLLALDRGNYSEAMDYCLKGENLTIELYGDFHPSLFYIYRNLVDIFRFMNKPYRVVDYLIKLNHVQRKLYGEANPEYIETLCTIGKEYMHIGDRTRAEVYLQRAFDLCSHHLGPNNPLTIAIDAILRQIKNT